MIRGNKGEWSEAYVLLKLLADGKLYAADDSLNKIEDIFYPIIKVLREEISNEKRSYVINGEIKVVDDNTGEELITIPVSKFIEKSRLLFEKIREAGGRSFAISEIEDFFNEIKVRQLKSITHDTKIDIKLVVHDLRTDTRPLLGFSIKSMLGQNATLFNPGNGTNFIYEIEGDGAENINPDEVNSVQGTPKIAKRIRYLVEHNCQLKYSSIQSENLELNLQMIDSDLPKILAKILLYKYSSEENHPRLASLVSEAERENFLNYNLSGGHPFYRQKIKNFLTDSALGMTPESAWEGRYSATGGIIIVKRDGELVCYHIYNRNEFQDYLLENTRLEQASTSRYNFGEVYLENGKKYIKLNLQVRFAN